MRVPRTSTKLYQSALLASCASTVTSRQAALVSSRAELEVAVQSSILLLISFYRRHVFSINK
jgi:hypothetical protein